MCLAIPLSYTNIQVILCVHKLSFSDLDKINSSTCTNNKKPQYINCLTIQRLMKEIDFHFHHNLFDTKLYLIEYEYEMYRLSFIYEIPCWP